MNNTDTLFNCLIRLQVQKNSLIHATAVVFSTKLPNTELRHYHIITVAIHNQILRGDSTCAYVS